MPGNTRCRGRGLTGSPGPSPATPGPSSAPSAPSPVEGVGHFSCLSWWWAPWGRDMCCTDSHHVLMSNPGSLPEGGGNISRDRGDSRGQSVAWKSEEPAPAHPRQPVALRKSFSERAGFCFSSNVIEQLFFKQSFVRRDKSNEGRSHYYT